MNHTSLDSAHPDFDKRRRMITLAALFATACGGGGSDTSVATPTPSPTPSPSPGPSPSPSPSPSSAPSPAPAPAPASPPTITDFLPTAAAAGAQVVISGSNFAANAAGNTVRFNSRDAVVLSATAHEIVAAVPAGAGSGRITMATVGGSALSAASFAEMLSTTVPGIAWTTRRAGATDGALAFGSGRWVCAGAGLSTSRDLLLWNLRKTLGARAADVVWDGRLFVAVGNAASVQTSPDGSVWTERATPSTRTLNAVASSGSRWVAVGDGGTILSSADGITWADAANWVGGLRGNSNFVNVVWTGSRFVIVANSNMAGTSTDGLTWTGSNPGNEFNSVAALGASPSLIVASVAATVGSQASHYTSPDGSTWTRRNPGSAPVFNDIAYAGGRWVGVGLNAIHHSDDGLTWTPVAVSIESELLYVAHDGSRFVAVGRTFGELYASADGIAWSPFSPGGRGWHGVASSPAGLAVAYSLERVQASSDGAAWSYGRLGPRTTHSFTEVTWYPAMNCFVALATVGANPRLFSSTDGLTWTDFAAAPAGGALGASTNLLVNASQFMSGSIYTSADGAVWAQRTLTGTPGLSGVAWLGDRWVAYGSGGTIITSTDGVSWVTRTSGVSEFLYGAAAGAGQIVIVGGAGRILTSADGGVSWTPRIPPTTLALNSVAWTGAEFVAVGASGITLRSTDGISWINHPAGHAYSMTSVAWTGQRLVVVGAGVVATSP